MQLFCSAPKPLYHYRDAAEIAELLHLDRPEKKVQQDLAGHCNNVGESISFFSKEDQPNQLLQWTSTFDKAMSSDFFTYLAKHTFDRAHSLRMTMVEIDHVLQVIPLILPQYIHGFSP